MGEFKNRFWAKCLLSVLLALAVVFVMAPKAIFAEQEVANDAETSESEQPVAVDEEEAADDGQQADVQSSTATESKKEELGGGRDSKRHHGSC